jgi:hypothetical protein
MEGAWEIAYSLAIATPPSNTPATLKPSLRLNLQDLCDQRRLSGSQREKQHPAPPSNQHALGCFSLCTIIVPSMTSQSS